MMELFHLMGWENMRRWTQHKLNVLSEAIFIDSGVRLSHSKNVSIRKMEHKKNASVQ